MDRKFSSLKLLLLILVGFLFSCSQQKNTPISRTFHSITAKYNILFNGDEGYRKGMKRLDESFKDDYSRILPVFTYGNKDVASSISSDMDLGIKKASKLITLHSIKAKPKVKKKGRMTPQEKEFYNKNEYNKWVDDAYILIGKAYFHKMDYQNATETFNFIIREYPKESSKYEGLIWLTRVHSQNGEFRDAEKQLATLESDRKFPVKLKRDLQTTGADLALKQNQYERAAKYLEKAIKKLHKKKLKLRYRYILAQLYQQTGEFKRATAMYTYIIKHNPPYEMTFNAQINLAESVETGSKSTRMVRDRLKKMLRDQKNIDFRDQIYFAMAKLEMKDGNRAQALEYFKESVKVSINNNDQKALSCLTLADLFYGEKKYVPAQAYYDSTLLYIAQDYPGVPDMKIKASSLNRLVASLNTISFEDSVQHVAKLPEAERMKLIDNIINDLRKAEDEAKQAEAQRLQEYYSNQNRNSAAMNDPTTQAKWYFYNPVSVAQGMKDFQLRWGKRKLEDNWRRRNKSIVAFGAEPTENILVENKQDKDKKKVLDNKSREFYVQNLPLTDSMVNISKKRVLDGYFNGGQVYRNELKDLKEATSIYETMIERFPENTYRIAVYYQLYTMFTEMGNAAKALYYKNLIITRFPESLYARLLSDPEYYKQLIEKGKEADNFYEETYNLYQSGQYQQVIANAQSAGTRFKGNSVMAKFGLIKAMAIGKTSDPMQYRNELTQLIVSYPNNEVAVQAKEMITFLNTYKPETKHLEDIKVAEVIYNPDDKSSFLFVLVVESKEDINQIVFDLINFNLDNFSNDHLELNNENFGKTYKILQVKTFSDKDKAIKYFSTLSSKPAALKSVKGGTKIQFIISPGNFEILKKQENADTYIEFFKKHF